MRTGSPWRCHRRLQQMESDSRLRGPQRHHSSPAECSRAIMNRGSRQVLILLLAALAVIAGCNVKLASARPRYMDASRSTADRVEDLLGQMTLPEKVGQMDQILVEHVTSAVGDAGGSGGL